MTRRTWALILLATLIGVALLIACSGGSANPASRVTVTLSDPATCSAPKGPFSHIYVTVVDVKVHRSAQAGDNDPGWQTVIPDNQGKPQQVDLLGAADTQCFLKRLGSTTELQAGSYQQIRVILADNTNLPSPNACGDVGANCVMLTLDETQTPHALLLSSEARTGIKIPGSQINGGHFVVEEGQQQDLNLDFNACASILTQGNGGFRLKPVLHAGEVTAVSTISGRIVDKGTSQAIAGGNVVVALEYNDNGTEMVAMQTVTDANGNFNFCPVSARDGGYDVVAVGISGTTAYAMTITTGVNAGAIMGDIPLTAMGTKATINGVVTAVNATPAGTIADISLSALQEVTINSVTVRFVVPLAAQGAVTVPLATESNASCPTGTFCKSYEMVLPAATPALGAFSRTSPSWSTPAAGTSYFINGVATVPGHSDQADCNPSNQTTPTAVAVVAGDTKTAPRLDFTACQ